ncbi:MAG: glycosyltransferase, partial [Candidatus Latescibacteria bacterium]|nr:glycosyltransferase [Candidatus Latescibacterota bacterium]
MKLGLLFTFEISLKKWDEAGLIDREMALYRKLADLGIQTTLFTYGDATEEEYKEIIGDSISVVPLLPDGTTGKWLRFFSSWIAPLRCKNNIDQCNVIKISQMWGSWAGIVCKLILRKKWVLRCGFEHHKSLLLQVAPLRDRVFSRIISWLAYRLADAVIWTNNSDHGWAVRKFGLRADDPRFHVVPNYVNT